MTASTHPPRTGPPSDGTLPPPPAIPPPPTVPPPPADRPPGRSASADRRTGIRPLGWALALIGAGVVWLLHLVGVTIDWQLTLPLAIIAIGSVLLIGGRYVARSGLVGLGLLLTVIALVLSVSPVTPSITAGDRDHTVADVAELDASYTLGAGTLTLDLRDLDLPAGTTELSASVAMGELVVRVPTDVRVTGTGQTFVGEVDIFGRTTAGVAPRAALEEAGTDDDRVLDLDLRTGFGRIEVTR